MEVLCFSLPSTSSHLTTTITMKALFSTFVLLVILFGHTKAQSVNNILESSLRVRENDKIFLHVENNVLKYDVGVSLNDNTLPTNFITLIDSTNFLVSNTSVNVFIRPFNPLNYSYNTQNTIIIDPISEKSSEALNSIIGFLDAKSAIKTTSAAGGRQASVKVNCGKYDTALIKIKQIKIKISDNKQKEINEIFKSLKELSFYNEASTISELAKIKVDIDKMNSYFKTLNDSTDSLRKYIEKYDCLYPDTLTAKFILSQVVKEITTIVEEQQKRLVNLQTIFKIVEQAQKTASQGGGEGLAWCIKLDEIPAYDRKVSVYTVIIKKSGYELSDKNEIVPSDTKEIIKKTLLIRRFKRFIPEVSAGVGYTFLKFPTFGTYVDTLTGKLFVVEGDDEEFDRISFTTMINFNYYASNTPVHIFWQLGIGANSDYPTLFLGGGFRLQSINNMGNLAVAGGLASTWIKTLNTLAVGDEVSGTAEIESDIKYIFNWPPKLYLAFQYNF